MNFQIWVTVAGGLKGLEIDDELWETTGIQKPLEELPVNMACSRYFLRLSLPDGDLYSVKKLWSQDFEQGEESGKADFGIKLER